jgi:hypothetical protein
VKINLSDYADEHQVAMILTASDAALRVAWAKRNARSAGRRKVLRRCPRCEAEMGARELRVHKCKPS